MILYQIMLVALCVQMIIILLLYSHLSSEEKYNVSTIIALSPPWIGKPPNEVSFTRQEQQQESENTTTSSNSPRLFALLTDPRCMDAIPFVLENALDMLPESYMVVYLHATSTVHCVKKWIQQSQTLSQAVKVGRLVTQVDLHIRPEEKTSGAEDKARKGSYHHQHSSANWNNIMYTNITFWESLKVYGDSVLTIQADTYICQKGDLPDRWKTVNYLGGMSKVPTKVPNYWNATNTEYFLNGGFSLRRLDWVVACLKKYTGPAAGEDTVFNTCPMGATSVQILDAMAFSSDGGYTLCFDYPIEKGVGTATSVNPPISTSDITAGGNGNNSGTSNRLCPYGVHQPWRLGRARGPGLQELVEYCPGIQTLSDRLGRNVDNVAECLQGWNQCTRGRKRLNTTILDRLHIAKAKQ